MKIAAIGDLHIGCTDYTDKRTSDFSNKFMEALDISFKKNVDCILLLGDIFDSSAYRRSIDSFATCLHDIAYGLVKSKEKGIPIICIMGNHEFGRGREGGELRILSDLGFVHLLKDTMIEIKEQKFCGISWKNDIIQFKHSLKNLEKYAKDSFLLVHQFISGASFVPKQIYEVDQSILKNWKKVFVGHHHIHEYFNNLCIPGSLEIHNVLELSRGHKKGFVIYDVDKNTEEFIELTSSRPIKYTELIVDGKTTKDVQHSLNEWVSGNAEQHALLIIKLKGKLSHGRSSEINFRESRILGVQKGCVSVSFINNIEDPIRSAPEIRASVNIEEFLKSWFKKDSKKAISYFNELKESGDDFIPKLRDKIVGMIK